MPFKTINSVEDRNKNNDNKIRELNMDIKKGRSAKIKSNITNKITLLKKYKQQASEYKAVQNLNHHYMKRIILNLLMTFY